MSEEPTGYFSNIPSSIRAWISGLLLERILINLNLGEKELNQVKKYMEIILSQDEFNGNNMYWEFFLIGNGFDTTGYIEREYQNAKQHGEMSLVYKVDRYKIYVKKWSEIFTDFEIRHKFLNEKLQLERNNLVTSSTSANDIIQNIDGNTALQPSEIVIPNK